MPENLLVPSARMALAGYLHDLGKFAQRADIETTKAEKDDNKSLYCPKYYTHVHAAYTGVALE